MTYPQGGQDGKPKRGYQASPEDTYYNLAQYYDIPTISFRCEARPGLQAPPNSLTATASKLV